MDIKAKKPGEGVLRPNGNLAIKAKNPEGGEVLRPNGKLGIKAKKLGEGALRPNGALDIKAKKTGQGALRPTTKSWELFHQFLLVYKKKFPTNLT